MAFLGMDPDTIEAEQVSFEEAYARLNTALDFAEHVTDISPPSLQMQSRAVERQIRREIQQLLVDQLASSTQTYVHRTAAIKAAVEPLKDAVKRINKLVADLQKAEEFAKAAARLVAILI